MQTLAVPCPACQGELHLHPQGRQCGCANLHVFFYPSMRPVPLTADSQPLTDPQEHDTAARIVLNDIRLSSAKVLKTLPPEPDLQAPVSPRNAP